MSHCCCAVIGYCDDEVDILDHHYGYGIDYYTLFENDENNQKWYRGLVLKDGKENDYMYIANDGNKYAYKAFIVDVDWEKTFNNISMFVTKRMVVDEYDFYDHENKCVDKKKFQAFFNQYLDNEEYITLVDVHV